MAFFLSLTVALSLLWLGLSGIYEPLILSLGAVSVLLCVILAYRLDILDRETAPYLRIVPLFTYWIWLFIEILKANWIVIRACLRADLDINPALVRVKTTCQSDLAKTVFANSITLTPGTVTVEVEGSRLLVHALYEEDASPGAFDEMDRRSRLATDGRTGGAS